MSPMCSDHNFSIHAFRTALFGDYSLYVILSIPLLFRLMIIVTSHLCLVIYDVICI